MSHTCLRQFSVQLKLVGVVTRSACNFDPPACSFDGVGSSPSASSHLVPCPHNLPHSKAMVATIVAERSQLFGTAFVCAILCVRFASILKINRTCVSLARTVMSNVRYFVYSILPKKNQEEPQARRYSCRVYAASQLEFAVRLAQDDTVT